VRFRHVTLNTNCIRGESVGTEIVTARDANLKVTVPLAAVVGDLTP
jgi:hypothetical protein